MRRFALRDLRSDEGLGLVETVVSLLVFALIMSGLAASMAVFARGTSLSRARQTATVLAQQYTEKARAVGSQLLENCSNQTPLPPATSQYRGDGINHTVATGTDSYCLPYQKAVSQDGISFTLTRLVLGRASGNDLAGQLQSEKYLVVQVAWTDGGGGAKTYELDTIFTQKGSVAAAPAQGIRFVIKDTSGNIISADSASWAVTITGSSCSGAGSPPLCTDPTSTTAEGTYSQVDLATGSYTCTATQTDDASSGYQPGAQSSGYNAGLTIGTDASGNATITGTCNVSANTVSDFVTTWQSSTDCATSSSTGTVNVVVTDSKNPPTALANMTVTLTQLNDGTKTFTKNTGSNGHADGLKPTANWYTYTVTDSTGKYATGPSYYGPVCIAAGTTVTFSVQMVPTGNCATTGANGTISVTVQDATTQAKLGGYKVNVANATTGTITALPNTNSSGVSSKGMAPGLYYYMAAPPAGNTTYQGSGYVGTICLASGVTQSYTVPLSAPTCARGSGAGAKGTLAFSVVDQSNNAVSGATVTLVNVNGDATPPAQSTTNGTTMFTNVVSDPYQYYVIGPGGKYHFDGLAPQLACVVTSGTTNVQVTLTGIFSVTVTVQNNDTVPWKTYQVTVASSDSTVQPITQSVTVPNCTPGTGCTRNPSAGLTFPGLLTGQYVITVCAQLKDGSCNQVDAFPTQPADGTVAYYSFMTAGGTYTPTTAGFSDLATVDDSGGA